MDAPPVRYVTARDGWRIAYSVSGSGRAFVHTPLVFSHLQLQWEQGTVLGRWMEALSQRFTVYSFNERGQGMSQRDLQESLSQEDYERDLEAVFERIPVGPAVLLGNTSLMAHTAIRFAVKHPNLVAALVLWNGRIQGHGFWDRAVGEVARNDWSAFLEMAPRGGFSYEQARIGRRLMEESWLQEDWLKRLDVLVKSNIEQEAPALGTPTLLLSVRNGPWAFGLEEEGKRLAALIPNSQLVLFDNEGTGLYSADGKEPPAIGVIEAFLDDVERRRPINAAALDSDRSVLSLREVEVLRLIAAGHSNPQIAEQLVISPNTVGRHVSNIFDKLGVANRVEATLYARDHGLA